MTARSGTVTCYQCLLPIDWGAQPPLRYDVDKDVLVEVPPAAQTSVEAWTRATVNALIRCPHDGPEPHYLPYNYGRYGQPIVVGFVGESSSGKTHLLSAMIQAIEAQGLQRHGLSHQWVDGPRHQKFVDNSVRPLFEGGVALQRTDRRIISFADAFAAKEVGQEPRVVALFDVAGEDLASVDEARQFLFVADALIFVADPTIFGDGSVLGDRAFTSVLNALPQERLARVASAIVLNKADMVRFDAPVDVWLHRPVVIDPIASGLESADVYAYLHRRGADSWTRPYQVCSRGTLHVASATGGDTVGGRFVRGVSPRRVLGPLLAVLAMTGAIHAPEARRIGI